MTFNQLLIAITCLGVSLNTVRAQEVSTVKVQTATVYVYRSGKFLSSTRKYWVYADGKPLCKLSNKHHCRVTVPVGTVTFSTKLAGLTIVPKKRPSLTLNLEEGKAYYLQADLKTQLLPLQAILPLTEVVPNADKLEEIMKSKVERALVSSAR